MATMGVLAETIDAGRNSSEAGFEFSPFSSGVVALAFADGFPLTIQRSVLRRCDKLGLLLDSPVVIDLPIDLRRFSVSAGHALVSYLYSGSYGQLKWTGPRNPTLDVDLVDLAAKFEIYALARTLELEGLEEQVRDHIERAARRLELFAVIDAIKETYPTPIGNDTWFPRWIKSLTRKALRRPRRTSKVPAPNDFGDSASVVKFLFGSMLEVYIDILEAQASQEVGVGADEVVDDTPVTESSLDEADGFDDSRRVNESMAIPGVTRDTDHFDHSITVPEAVAESTVSEEECKLLRELLANRDRPIWWSALQVHITQPPSHIGTHEPKASVKADYELEPTTGVVEGEVLCKEQPPIVDEPKPESEEDTSKTPAKKKSKKKGLKKKVKKPEPGPELALEPETVPTPDEPALESEEPQAVPEPEPEPEPELEPVVESTNTVSGHSSPPVLNIQPRTRPLWGTWDQHQERVKSLEIGSAWVIPSHEETVVGVSKNKKRGKGAKIKRTASDAEEVPAEAAEPLPSMERMDGEMESPEVVEREPDPWVFWGVAKEKRSPRTSFGVDDCLKMDG